MRDTAQALVAYLGPSRTHTYPIAEAIAAHGFGLFRGAVVLVP